MRITESQLRRVVRVLIKEAPLADYYPTSYVGTSTSSAGAQPGAIPKKPADPRDLEHARRVYSSPKFKEKLQKLLKNFPVDVYVLPVAADVAGDYMYLLNRFNVIDKSSLKTDPLWIGREDEWEVEGKKYTQKSGPVSSQEEFRNFVENWAENSPPDACLICSFAKSGGDRIQQVTPWNIFHAMFDSEVDFTAREILEACPSIEKIKSLATKIAGLEYNHESPVSVDDLEKIFTMGSARQGYWSRVIPDAFPDVANEVACQAAITTNGFTYNADAVEDLPVDDSVKENIKSILKQMVDISPRCKSEFANFLRGKIILSATYPES